jgi:hypothetical protein
MSALAFLPPCTFWDLAPTVQAWAGSCHVERRGGSLALGKPQGQGEPDEQTG